MTIRRYPQAPTESRTGRAGLRHCLSPALLSAAMLIAPIANAQGSSTGQTIIVTGTRQMPAKQAEKFVRQIESTSTGQLARFLDPVCPLVLGVKPRIAGAMTDRIRQVAADAGVRVAPEGCEPNVIAVVAKSADAFIAFMRKRHGSFFDDLSDTDLKAAFRSGTVHSWRLVEARDEDGQPLSGDPPMAESYSSSVFSLPTQAAAVNAVIVIDEQAVLNKTPMQLADYIAMRTLAGARPPKKTDAETPGTILSLFDPGTPPKELTGVDARFLAGLYASKPMTNAMSQVFDISHRMAQPAEPSTPRK